MNPVSPGPLQFHPLANRFPMMPADEQSALGADIAENGVLDKIVMHEGMILDGRNRYCQIVLKNIDPPSADWRADQRFVDFHKISGGLSPVKWVIAKNLHRRHLGEGERAMIAAGFSTLLQGQHKAANLPDTEEAPQPEQAAGMTQTEAAEALQVSERSVRDARRVIDHGAEGLADLVQAGKVSVSAAAQVAEMPVEEQAELIRAADPKAFARVAKEKRAEKTAEKRERRRQTEVALGKKMLATGDRKAAVLYLDPEWRYLTRSDAGMDRAADNHYPTSKLIEIMRRAVADVTAPDALIFMWATVPMLMEAICVLDAYGFVLLSRDQATGFLLPDKTTCEYVSHLAWVKTDADGDLSRGTGYWFINSHEILLVARRGKVIAPAPGTQPLSVLMARRAGHSVKPDDVLEIIEGWYPTLPKLELNRRGKPRPGWMAWGNEVEADPDNGIEVDENGFADASHLPLPSRALSLSAQPAPPHESHADRAGRAASGPGGLEGEAATPRYVAASPIITAALPSGDGVEARFIELGNDLPKSKAKQIEIYAEAMAGFDAAMRAGDEAAARREGERMGAVLFKVNGNTMFALDTAKAPTAIRKATAAERGAVPMWGQNGSFVAEVRGMECLVECAWPSIRFFAASKAPFFSETGFLDVHPRVDGLGLTVTDFVLAVADEALAEAGGALVEPSHFYRMGRVGPVPAHAGEKA